MNRTKIEWADATWNPLRGCSRVSDGCRNCYAERIAARFSTGPERVDVDEFGDLIIRYDGPFTGIAEMMYDGPRWTRNVRLVESALDEPRRWRKPKRIFVCSMSDLFYEVVKDEWIEAIFQVMRECTHHTFLVLTKRAKRMEKWCSSWPHWPLPNVWLGVSVENQSALQSRLPHLIRTPARVRFLSCEPLLGPIQIGLDETMPRYWATCYAAVRDRIHWVIAGGESGHGARPMHPDWVRSIRDECAAANVPFFFKQWGEWLPLDQFGADGDKPNPSLRPLPDGSGSISVFRLGKRDSGRLLDGVMHMELPNEEIR